MTTNNTQKTINYNKTKVLEIGDEGSSVTLYRFNDVNNKEWFFHVVGSSAYGSNEIGSSENRSDYSYSYTAAFIRLEASIKGVLGLYALYVAPEYRNNTLDFINIMQETEKSYINKERWAEVLGVEINEFTF